MTGTAILQATALRKDYELAGNVFGRLLGKRSRRIRAVDDVDLAIHAGEGLALVGESGSGKTSLGKLIARLDDATAGRICFDGKDVTTLVGARLKAFRRDVQMIFQNPYDSLDPRIRIGAAVNEPLALHGVGTALERRRRAVEALASVELRPPERFFDRLPRELSGGQLQRVSIARALVLSPKLIVADEAVSMLDVSVRSGVIKLMLALQRERGIAYVYITHDLAVARYMASRIAVMYLGAIVEEGPADAVIANAAHPYTRLLISAIPEHRSDRRRARVRIAGDSGGTAQTLQGCRFQSRCPLVQERCRNVAPTKIQVAPRQWALCHFASDVAAGVAPLVKGRTVVGTASERGL